MFRSHGARGSLRNRKIECAVHSVIARADIPMKLGQCGTGVARPEGTEREQVKHNSGRSSREDTDACRPRCLAIEWNRARLSAFAE